MKTVVKIGFSFGLMLSFLFIAFIITSAIKNQSNSLPDVRAALISMMIGGVSLDGSSEAAPLSTTSSAELKQGDSEDSGLQNQALLTDKMAPIVTITGVAPGATYVLGSVPEAFCVATDTQSNVDIPALPSFQGGPVGSVTVTCSSATDYAGNASAPVSVTYKVIDR